MAAILKIFCNSAPLNDLLGKVCVSILKLISDAVVGDITREGNQIQLFELCYSSEQFFAICFCSNALTMRPLPSS